LIPRLYALLPLIADQLKSAQLKLATAESCTGGGLSFWLTSLAGSSDWFDRGFVTYSDEAKIEILGVDPTTLHKFGAVSEEVAHEMAIGALNQSDANMSVAITGIAGPGGGSQDKPVGTVWIALAKKNKDTPFAKHFIFSGDREAIRLQTIVEALALTHGMLSH